MEKEKLHEKGKNTLKKKRNVRENEREDIRRQKEEKERDSKLTATWLFSNRLRTIAVPFHPFFPLFARLSPTRAFIQRRNTEKTEEETEWQSHEGILLLVMCAHLHTLGKRNGARVYPASGPGLDEKSVWPKGQSERALDEREKNEEPGGRGRKGGWNRVKQGVARWKERVSCGQGAHVSLEIARFGYRVSSLELIRAWKTETRRSIYHVSYIVSPKKFSNRVFLRLRSLVSAFRSFYRRR